MQYEIFSPEVSTTIVVDPYDNPAGLKYVSNSSLAYWAGRFWAVMDGSVAGTVENSSDQRIWMTTSEDGEAWGEAFQPFRDGDYCTNPVTSTSIEFQPNLVVVGDELWCVWCVNASGATNTAFVSKLSDPEGKWTTHRFEFNGVQVSTSTDVTSAVPSPRSVYATWDSISDWECFPTQNPIVLSSGDVLCPVVFQSRSNLSAQSPTASNFVRYLKRAGVLRLHEGQWSIVLADTSAQGDFIAWEPFVAETPVGQVYLFIRSLDMRVPDDDYLLVAVSYDGGETFAPAVSTKMLVPSTRGFARRISVRRWVMTHLDRPQHSTGSPTQTISLGRRNGALFTSMRGANDFIPGISWSGNDGSVHYPQFIEHDGDLYINYTSGTGSNIRRSLRIAKVAAPLDDTRCYVLPRSAAEQDPTEPTNPTLHAGTPPFYDFNGLNRAMSQSPVAAASAVTFTAWLKREYDGSVLVDTRASSATDFGQAFLLNGLAVGSINFLHGFVIEPDTPVFLAAVIDGSAQTVTLYGCRGDAAFETKVGHYRSMAFSGQPANGETVTINGVTYTFRTTASLSTDVAIGASVGATITNLRAKLTGITTYAPVGNARFLMARSDLASFAISSSATNVTAETQIPVSGGPAIIGHPLSTSTLLAFNGSLYEARVYGSALTEANLASLYNAQASKFGYGNLSGASTPGAPLLLYSAASPNPSAFPLLAVPDPGYCEVISDDVLRIHGEGSAAVELPYAVTDVAIRFKLGAPPAGSERYVVATFGTGESPLRLYVDAKNPADLYANGVKVGPLADHPDDYSALRMRLFTNKIQVGSFEHYFTGKPRCYLGNAFPEGLLPNTRSIDYFIPAMTAAQALGKG